MIKIFEQMGPKSEQDLSFLSDETAVEYAEQLSNRAKINSSTL